MRQLDVFRHPDPRAGRAYPYLIVLQSDAVPDTRSVIAAPLVREGPSGKIYPRVVVEGKPFAIVISDLAAVPRSLLKRRITNVLDDRDRIIAALDLLFTGIQPMADIVNLRQARKRKERAGKEAQAEANRVAFGRSKEERLMSEARKDLDARRLDGHRLADKEPE